MPRLPHLFSCSLESVNICIAKNQSRLHELVRPITVLRNCIHFDTLPSFFYRKYQKFGNFYNEMEFPDTDLKQLVLKLAKTLEQLEIKATDQESKITTLRNEITDLNGRVSSQERHSSKDCLLLYNFPVDAPSRDLDVETCKILKFYFNYELSSGDLKACHSSRKRQNTGLSVPMKIKLIQFRRKNKIYARRKMLVGYQSQDKFFFHY